MLRIIARQNHLEELGTNPIFKTFDVDWPDLEAYLRETVGYGSRTVIGAELLPEDGLPAGAVTDCTPTSTRLRVWNKEADRWAECSLAFVDEGRTKSNG